MKELILIYDIKHKSRIKILGEKFIENNRNNCKIKINDKIEDMKEYYQINPEDKNKDYLTVTIFKIFFPYALQKHLKDKVVQNSNA